MNGTPAGGYDPAELLAQYDATDIKGNAQARKKAREKVLLAQLEWESRVAWLMGTETGRHLAAEFMEASGMDRITTSTNAIQNGIDAGAANMGKFLKNAIKRSCPEQWPVMLREQEQRKAHD